MYFRIGSGKYFAVRVIQFEFDLQGSQGGVESVRGAYRFCRKSLVRLLGKTQFRIQPRTGGGGVAFRYLHVYAQLMHIGDAKQFASGALTGIDQRSNVGVARGDDAAERGYDPLERLELAHSRRIAPPRIPGPSPLSPPPPPSRSPP